MSNQNDNNFGDDNDLDDIFTSDDDPMNETGIQDAVEAIDDISDYDDSEEGIFAPAPEKKKSGSSSALLGTVAVAAVLAAGGFYVYKNPSIMASLMGGDAAVSEPAPVADVVPQETPVDVAVAEQAAPPITEIQPVQDPELSAIPQPQPISNVEDAAGVPAEVTAENAPVDQSAAEMPAPVATETAPVDAAPVDAAPIPAPVETVATPAVDPVANVAPAESTPTELVALVPENSVTATADVPSEITSAKVEGEQPSISTSEPEAPVVASADLPPPPTPEETKAAIAPTPAPVEAAESVAPVAETKEPLVKPVEAPAKTPEVVAEPAPKQEELAKAPVPVVQKKVEPAPKVEVTKPAKDPETVYFDAPEGKALTNLPTPSMNPKRGKNESIIIVGGKSSSTSTTATGAVTATNQDSGVVAAGRALRLGRYDAALDMYSDLYRANPRDARILMGRAIALQKLGRSAEAISAYEEVIAVDDDNPEALVNLMGLVRKEYPALALEKLLTLREKHPDNAGIAAQLGVAYADAGNLDDAARYLMTASRMEPQNPQHYFNLGVVAERMKNRTRAIAYYEKALEVDAVYGTGRAINRDMIYDRLTRLRG